MQRQTRPVGVHSPRGAHTRRFLCRSSIRRQPSRPVSIAFPTQRPGSIKSTKSSDKSHSSVKKTLANVPSDYVDDILADIPQESLRSATSSKFTPRQPLSTSYTNDNRPHNTRPINPLNKRNYETVQQLHRFIYAGELSSVKDWLQHRSNRTKIDFNSQDGFGSTLLGGALRKHFYNIVAVLLPFCDLNATTAQGPPIFHAIQVNDIALMRILLDFGANPNGVGPEGQTALMLAATIPSISPIMGLLSHGATLDNQDASGRTALMYAASRGLHKNMEFLWRCGANVTITDRSGKTALDYLRQQLERNPSMTTVEETLRVFQEQPIAPITLPRIGRFSHGLLTHPRPMNGSPTELPNTDVNNAPEPDFPPAPSPFVDQPVDWSPAQLRNAISLTSLMQDRRDYTRPLNHSSIDYKTWYRTSRAATHQDAVERQANLDAIHADERQFGRLRHGQREAVEQNENTTETAETTETRPAIETPPSSTKTDDHSKQTNTDSITQDIEEAIPLPRESFFDRQKASRLARATDNAASRRRPKDRRYSSDNNYNDRERVHNSSHKPRDDRRRSSNNQEGGRHNAQDRRSNRSSQSNRSDRRDRFSEQNRGDQKM